MDIFITIIICLCSYSLLLSINNIVKDYKAKDVTISDFILGGIFGWIIWIISFVVVKIKRLRKKLKYKSLIQDKNGNIFWCNFDRVEKIIQKYDVNFANGEDFIEYFDIWDKSMCFGNLPNMRYAPIQVWKKYKKFKNK